MIRRCSDIDTLMAWRREVIADVFGVTPSRQLLTANEKYYAAHISNGSHLAFIVTDNGVDIGCGAICVTDELPRPTTPTADVPI